MKIRKSILFTAALLLCALGTRAQSFSEYRFIFSGTAYHTNAAGVLVATHITDANLLATRAKEGNITDLSTVAIVYHINGDPLGDTVDIITTKGAYLTTEFGFYFGSDAALGRTSVGDPNKTGQHRVDPIYTFADSPFTYSNSDSVGAAFTFKRFVKGPNGGTNAIIHGTMSWAAIPSGTNTSPTLCVGTFSIGRPMF